MDPSKLLPPSASQEAAVRQNDALHGGLYEELKREKAKFVAFMDSSNRTLDGSVHGLYDRFEYVYRKRDELVKNLLEFEKLKNDEFFECSDAKPNEGNLIRQLLYFFNDAKTKRKRDRWSKAATVLEHFRSLGIGHGDVTRLMKEGGGFVKVYNSLPSAKFDDDGVHADHEVFATATSGVDDSTVGSVNLATRGLGNAATESHASQDAVAVQPVDGSSEAQGRDSLEPSVAVAAAADRDDDVAAGGGESEHSSPPATLRDALKNHVLLRTFPPKMSIALTPGRNVLFVEVTGYDRWIDVQMMRAIPLDGEQSQWPRLDFSGQTNQRSAPDRLSSAIDADAHEPERSIPHVSISAVDAPPKRPPGSLAQMETKGSVAATSRPKTILEANRFNAKVSDVSGGRGGTHLADSKIQKSKVVQLVQRAPEKTVTVATMKRQPRTLNVEVKGSRLRPKLVMEERPRRAIAPRTEPGPPCKAKT